MFGRVILATLALIASGTSFGAPPEWVSQPKSSDTFFTYAVGNATRASKQNARDAAYQDALEQLAQAITSRPRVFDLPNVEVLEGCEHFQGFPPFVQCWVQVSFPLAEVEAIQNEIAFGEELNTGWREAATAMDAGQYPLVRELLDRLQDQSNRGLYLDFTPGDLGLMRGDSFLREGRIVSAIKQYREQQDNEVVRARAAEKLLLAGDAYLDTDRPQEADRVYLAALETLGVEDSFKERCADRIVNLGEYYRKEGDFSYAWNYYHRVLAQEHISDETRALAQTRLESIPKPPRAWPLHKVLGNRTVGLLCVLRQNGEVQAFPELAMEIGRDLTDARGSIDTLNRPEFLNDSLLNRVIGRLDFSAILSAAHDPRPDMILAILVDVDPNQYGQRLDTLARVVLFDCEEQVMLQNISIRERWAGVPIKVLAEHIAGVLIFRHLCLQPQPIPNVGVRPVKAGSGVGDSLANLMTRTLSAALGDTETYRIMPDPESPFFRTLPSANRQDPDQFVEYGKAGYNLRLAVTVNKIADTYHLHSELLDQESEGVLKQASTEFTRIGGAFLEYEMKRHISELLGLTPPRRPSRKETSSKVLAGSYANLPPELVAIEEKLEVDLRKLEKGSTNAKERQQRAAVEHDMPLRARTRKTEIEFSLIPEGSLMTLEGNRVAAFEHSAFVSRYEITQSQWHSVMRDSPVAAVFDGDDRPMENISAPEAEEFCRRLGILECGDPEAYRLLNSHEWEYAARAGTHTPYYTGDDERDLKRAGWFEGSSTTGTQSVGRRLPNAWGLHDTHGNVWEWTTTVRDGASKWTPRGGSWNSSAIECQVGTIPPFYPPRANVIGFRITRNPEY